MNILHTVEAKLRSALSPTELKVRDDSGLHYGHDGASPGHISHVAIRVVSSAFDGKTRVARSRMVFSAIADEVKQIHAVTQLVTLTPKESESK